MPSMTTTKDWAERILPAAIGAMSRMDPDFYNRRMDEVLLVFEDGSPLIKFLSDEERRRGAEQAAKVAPGIPIAHVIARQVAPLLQSFSDAFGAAMARAIGEDIRRSMATMGDGMFVSLIGRGAALAVCIATWGPVNLAHGASEPVNAPGGSA